MKFKFSAKPPYGIDVCLVHADERRKLLRHVASFDRGISARFDSVHSSSPFLRSKLISSSFELFFGLQISCSFACLKPVVCLFKQAKDNPMPQHVNKAVLPPKSHAEEDTVLTPAGPLPADQVVHLRPGQAVRRNDDGSVSVVESPDSKPSPTHIEKKEGDTQ